MTTIKPQLKANGAMSEPFDPYRKWLGIPPKEQPPHHYRLLGIATFEDDLDVIENAASRQMAHVRTFQTGKHGPISQRLLTELSAAKVCLLNRDQKLAYDTALRARLAADGKLSSPDLGPALQAASPGGGEDEVPEPDFPPLQQVTDARWRTESPPLQATAPPPVPIPMRHVSAASAAAPLPTVRRTPSHQVRSRNKPTAMPIVVLMFGLLALVVLGGAAYLVVTQLPETNGSGEKSPTDKSPWEKTKPKGTDTTERPSSERPSTEGESSTSMRPAPPAIPPVGKSPSAGSSSPTPQLSDRERAALHERLRQTIATSRRGLAERNDHKFRQSLVEAEQLLAQYRAETAAFQQDVADLRELKRLVDGFWNSVRDSVHNKLGIGDKTALFGQSFELVSREGELVEFRLNDELREAEIGKFAPQVAMLIAAGTLKSDEPATLLPAAAFLALDAQASDDDRKAARQLFARARQAGQISPAVARQLGLKDPAEPIELDAAFDLPSP